ARATQSPPGSAPKEFARSAVYSPDRTTVLTNSKDHLARLWDTATGRPRGAPLKHSLNQVRALAFSPDGKMVATACLRDKVVLGQARIWDAATGRPLSPWLEHRNQVASLAFSPDSRLLATGDYDMAVRFWEAPGGKPCGSVLPQRDIVVSLAFSPDGRTLVAGTSNDWHRDPQARL